MKRNVQNLPTKALAKWNEIRSNFRESPVPFMAPAISGSLLELAVVFYFISLAHLSYMQLTMPIRLPLLSYLSAFPEGVAIIMMRSRIAYCLLQASDPILRRKFSRREWRSQNRTGAITLAMASILYFGCVGIMGTRLTLILSTPVVISCGLAIIFALMPPPRNMEECLEYAEYGQQTPLARFFPGIVKRLEEDPFHLANRA